MSGAGAARASGPPEGAGYRDTPSGGSAARDEAERLVASVLGTASVALRTLAAGGRMADLAAARDVAGAIGGTGVVLRGVAGAAQRLLGDAAGGHSLANDSAECCVCPVCRLIRAVREPSPELVVRAATTAGDLATGVAAALRAVNDLASTLGRAPSPAVPSPAASSPAASSPAAPPAAPVPASRFTPAEIWQAATRLAGPAPASRTGPWSGAGDPRSLDLEPQDAPARDRLREADPWRAATREHGTASGTAGTASEP